MDVTFKIHVDFNDDEKELVKCFFNNIATIAKASITEAKPKSKTKAKKEEAPAPTPAPEPEEETKVEEEVEEKEEIPAPEPEEETKVEDEDKEDDGFRVNEPEEGHNYRHDLTALVNYLVCKLCGQTFAESRRYKRPTLNLFYAKLDELGVEDRTKISKDIYMQLLEYSRTLTRADIDEFYKEYSNDDLRTFMKEYRDILLEASETPGDPILRKAFQEQARSIVEDLGSKTSADIPQERRQEFVVRLREYVMSEVYDINRDVYNAHFEAYDLPAIICPPGIVPTPPDSIPYANYDLEHFDPELQRIVYESNKAKEAE